MIGYNWKLQACPYADDYELYLWQRAGEYVYVGESIRVKIYADTGYLVDSPKLGSFDKATLQNLFNELWREGFRPKGEQYTDSTFAALKGHLEDMRTLVFKK